MSTTISVLEQKPMVQPFVGMTYDLNAAGSARNLLAKAQQHHKDGDLDEAETLYRKSVQLCPTNADAQHLLGALLIQRYGSDELKAACEHLQRAIVLDPSQAKYRHSLGVAFEVAGNWNDAIQSYQRAVDKDPFNTKFLMSLVKPLTYAKRFTRVTEVCRAVLALDPAHPRANFKCASALRQLRRQPEAIMHYRRHLEHYPNDEQAIFWIGILTGDDVPRAPASHIASLFDCYADNFDSHLVKALQYRTPSLLSDAIDSAASQVESKRQGYWERCTDLGCGTGLMGPLLREKVGHLSGVDLSSKMLDKAREKGVYDELVAADLETYLTKAHSATAKFDLFVAADVLVYIGDLAPVFKAAAAAAAPGAMFALSTEQRDAAEGGGGVREGVDRGYTATLTGRFQHAREYVERMGRGAGWSMVSCDEAVIRSNAGKPIAGNLFVFVKHGAEGR